MPKVSALTEATVLTDDDQFLVVDGATSKRATYATVKAGAWPVTNHDVPTSAAGYNHAAANAGFALTGPRGYQDTSIAISEGNIQGGFAYARNATFDRIIADNNTAKSSGGVVHFCWFDITTDGTVGALVGSLQLAADGAAGNTLWTVTSTTINAGWYFFGWFNPADTFGTWTTSGTIGTMQSSPVNPSAPLSPDALFAPGGTSVPSTLVGVTPFDVGGQPYVGVINSGN